MKSLIPFLLLSAKGHAKKHKGVLHQVEGSADRSAGERSFDPLSGGGGGESDGFLRRDGRISFGGDRGADGGSNGTAEEFAAESENEESAATSSAAAATTTTTTTIAALSAGVRDPSASNRGGGAADEQTTSPFLSATLQTTLSPVPASALSAFGSERRSSFGSAYVRFLEHVLKAQEAYDVRALSASVFDAEILDPEEGGEESGRKLLTNGLQFSFARDDDFASLNRDDDDAAAAAEPSDAPPADAAPTGLDAEARAGSDERVRSALRFGVVVSAERVEPPSSENYVSDRQFRRIVLHISKKFHGHLVQFVRDADSYFGCVEEVSVDGFDGADGGEGETPEVGLLQKMEEEVKAAEEGNLGTWSIVAIALGGVAFVGIMFATVKIYRREKVLKSNRWRSREIVNSNASTSSVKSLRVLQHKHHHPIEDDYSFDPLATNVTAPQQHRPGAKEHIQRLCRGYTDKMGYTDIPLDNSTEDEASSSKRPKVAPAASSPLFPGAPPARAAAHSHRSLDEEAVSVSPSDLLCDLPKQHVYAPPGKVGVAIDIRDGQPVVHKVKRGSPLEGLLQPRDIVVAIDDVDTSCMSAADVTHLMVKRMNYRRKITFVRRC